MAAFERRTAVRVRRRSGKAVGPLALFASLHDGHPGVSERFHEAADVALGAPEPVGQFGGGDSFFRFEDAPGLSGGRVEHKGKCSLGM